jgi:hypothetical protein
MFLQHFDHFQCQGIFSVGRKQTGAEAVFTESSPRLLASCCADARTESGTIEERRDALDHCALGSTQKARFTMPNNAAMVGTVGNHAGQADSHGPGEKHWESSRDTWGRIDPCCCEPRRTFFFARDIKDADIRCAQSLPRRRVDRSDPVEADAQVCAAKQNGELCESGDAPPIMNTPSSDN